MDTSCFNLLGNAFQDMLYFVSIYLYLGTVDIIFFSFWCEYKVTHEVTHAPMASIIY